MRINMPIIQVIRERRKIEPKPGKFFIVCIVDNVNKLSQYLPLRFLICMISAISNPFLYGYYNETFKNGLEKIYSYLCPQKQRKPKKKETDHTESLSLELTSKKVVK